MKEKKLIIIAGPTAVGKTSFSIPLAKHFQTEIISADSRQFYKELQIGTAKPTLNEQQGVKHHFLDFIHVEQDYSAGQFEKEAIAILKNKFKEKDEMIVCGGSGLFIRALCEGFDDLGELNPVVRENLNKDLKNKGISYLLELLKEKDPHFYTIVDKNNPRRVLRALEVYFNTGRPYSEQRTSVKENRFFKTIYILLERPREILYERINKRVDEMIELGLEEEARTLLPYKQCNSLQTVGYREFFAYFNGEISKSECIEKIKQNTRHYAKRQLTWFRNQGNYNVINLEEANALSTVLHYIENKNS
jgi:tRNA dimethylallyltransferase